MDLLQDKATGVLAGAAVGDALGGAAEGNTPEAIQQRYGGYIDGIVGPFFDDWRNARPIAPYHKGDGHITDDTLMTTALVDVYATVRDHLDAFSIADHLVPLLIGEKRWVPELESEALLLHRIFLAEKWLVARLHYGHIDPREAGVGNIVNCGATMYVAPIGIANAGSPDTAYAEGIDVAGAHQSSYGREAAGVFAASVAEAMRPGASVSSVIATALRLAKDGTRDAIEAVVNAADGITDWREAIGPLRRAVTPYDTVGADYRKPARDARIPNRTKSIEELPIALGMLVVAAGDYPEAVLGAVNYGRDSDSIATMAGAICGALNGVDNVPLEWREAVSTASRVDLEAPAATMTAVSREIWTRDQQRSTLRGSTMSALTAPAPASFQRSASR
ncbi:ADP-ribosylglycohydrolase family protein [Cryobacterium sp. Hh11]|uniref:ADP-ribosylglycohydrolase family protein n=1 Tax=Cryobacterium sp. Hh11 TaxID=2555868 RepID=UPI00106D07BA|nr:ADP-ribosylglycohydrolase family protein [Cryobacterium sp. Hh11]TFD54249.1 ADP-ribosylglycohydrolase family protein [Cryobacterium sp. Hh11]